MIRTFCDICDTELKEIFNIELRFKSSDDITRDHCICKQQFCKKCQGKIIDNFNNGIDKVIKLRGVKK